MTRVNNDYVAIIMATFNGEKWIEEQIASIRAQTHPYWHIFVRDDGSSDATLATLQQLLPGERFTIVDPGGKATGSPAGNFLRALCEINLENFGFVAFADQDDVWSPGKLARALACLDKEQADGYSCDLVAYDNGARRAWYINKSQPPRALDYLFQGASAGCTYVLTNKAAQLVIDKIQPFMPDFPKQRSHDWLVYAICRSHGLSWVADDSAHIFYRQHASNAFGALPNARGLLARWRLARQRWYREHVLWLSEVLAMTAAEKKVLCAVRDLTFADRLALARRSREFRRVPRDQVLLAMAIVFGSF